jgi:hypothetical protein
MTIALRTVAAHDCGVSPGIAAGMSGVSQWAATIGAGGLPTNEWRVTDMIVLGVVLLVIGFIASIPILWTIGLVLVVVGAVLALVGRTGRKVGGRAHWY